MSGCSPALKCTFSHLFDCPCPVYFRFPVAGSYLYVVPCTQIRTVYHLPYTVERSVYSFHYRHQVGCRTGCRTGRIQYQVIDRLVQIVTFGTNFFLLPRSLLSATVCLQVRVCLSSVRVHCIGQAYHHIRTVFPILCRMLSRCSVRA